MPVEYKKVRRTISVPQEYTCDLCDAVFSTDNGSMNDIFEIQEMVVIEKVSGYASVFGDGTKINFCICQTCLFNMLKDKGKV